MRDSSPPEAVHVRGITFADPMNYQDVLRIKAYRA
jgi:hypothetical protein